MIDLRLGDCLDILRALPDGCVDAVITDPPYGIGENNRKNLARIRPTSDWKNPRAINYGDYEWDKERIGQTHFQLIRRASKHQVIFGGNYYTDYLPPSASWIVWDKKTTGDFAACELAWTSHKRAVRIFRYLWSGYKKEKPEQRFHPTQKPLALMEWIVDNYTTEGDTILDPFMGSGTTGVACVKLNRSFIGIEINPDYFAIAKKRIQEAQLQMHLPLPY